MIVITIIYSIMLEIYYLHNSLILKPNCSENVDICTLCLTNTNKRIHEIFYMKQTKTTEIVYLLFTAILICSLQNMLLIVKIEPKYII